MFVEDCAHGFTHFFFGVPGAHTQADFGFEAFAANTRVAAATVQKRLLPYTRSEQMPVGDPALP